MVPRRPTPVTPGVPWLVASRCLVSLRPWTSRHPLTGRRPRAGEAPLCSGSSVPRAWTASRLRRAPVGPASAAAAVDARDHSHEGADSTSPAREGLQADGCAPSASRTPPADADDWLPGAVGLRCPPALRLVASCAHPWVVTRADARSSRRAPVRGLRLGLVGLTPMDWPATEDADDDADHDPWAEPSRLPWVQAHHFQALPMIRRRCAVTCRDTCMHTRGRHSSGGALSEDQRGAGRRGGGRR